MPSGLLYLSAMPVLSTLLALRLSHPSRGLRLGRGFGQLLGPSQSPRQAGQVAPLGRALPGGLGGLGDGDEPVRGLCNPCSSAPQPSTSVQDLTETISVLHTLAREFEHCASKLLKEGKKCVYFSESVSWSGGVGCLLPPLSETTI